jgi:hypothetical protein
VNWQEKYISCFDYEFLRIILLQKYIPLKNISLFLLTCLVMTSCKMYYPGHTPVKPTPFVQTETGTRISAEKVVKEKKEIIADGKVYDMNDVSFYSDGKETYAKISRKYFAPRIAEGKLNLYQFEFETTSYSSGFGNNAGGMRTSTHRTWYVQDSGSNSLLTYDYKSLKSLIPTNSPAGELLKGYKMSRRKSNLILCAGFGMFIAGSAIAGGAIINDQSKAKVHAGLYTLVASAGVITYAIVIRAGRSRTLVKAFNTHNGVIMPD